MLNIAAMRRTLLTLSVAASLVLVAACGSDDGGEVRNLGTLLGQVDTAAAPGTPRPRPSRAPADS